MTSFSRTFISTPSYRPAQEWRLHHIYSFWKQTPLIDGSSMRFGTCMRRYVGGSYQYRRETKEEERIRIADGYA